MAATATAPVPVGSAITPDEDRLIGLLREVREECQNLQESLAQIKQLASLSTADVRPLVAACVETAKIFESNRPQLASRLLAIRQVLDLNSRLLALFGDAVTEVENIWERICMHWPTGSEAVEVLTQRIDTVYQELDRIVYAAELSLSRIASTSTLRRSALARRSTSMPPLWTSCPRRNTATRSWIS